VVINEVLTSNSIQEDEYGESNDWIELYNASANVIDLGGAHLSDTVGDPLRWTFRAGTLIAPGEYLMVWADDDEEQWFHHTNFNLTSLGETLTLSDATGNPIDQVQYPLQVQDISYGRYPNGVGPWTYMETTFGGTNNTPLSVSNVHSTEASTIAWPNPVKSELFIRSEGSMLHSWRLYDISGQLLMAESTNTLQANIDLSGTSDGVYILTVDLDNGDTSTFRIIKE
jgi:hypothetical protein